jgi:hypothetical protein
MKIYKVKKGSGIKLILWVFALSPFLVFAFQNRFGLTSLFMFLVLLIPFLLVGWIYFGSSYWIENDKLFYRSGFLKGDLDINQISSITKNKTSRSGVKPAMAGKGLIIKMKYDEIYVAPEDNEEMVEDLLKINPGIDVKG